MPSLDVRVHLGNTEKLSSRSDCQEPWSKSHGCCQGVHPHSSKTSQFGQTLLIASPMCVKKESLLGPGGTNIGGDAKDRAVWRP